MTTLSTPLSTLAGIFPSRTYHAAYLASSLWSLREALAQRERDLARAYETRITDACYSPEEDLLPDCGAVLVALYELCHEVRS